MQGKNIKYQDKVKASMVLHIDKVKIYTVPASA